jgi:hypothetical protein
MDLVDGAEVGQDREDPHVDIASIVVVGWGRPSFWEIAVTRFSMVLTL